MSELGWPLGVFPTPLFHLWTNGGQEGERTCGLRASQVNIVTSAPTPSHKSQGTSRPSGFQVGEAGAPGGEKSPLTRWAAHLPPFFSQALGPMPWSGGHYSRWAASPPRSEYPSSSQTAKRGSSRRCTSEPVHQSRPMASAAAVCSLGLRRETGSLMRWLQMTVASLWGNRL